MAEGAGLEPACAEAQPPVSNRARCLSANLPCVPIPDCHLRAIAVFKALFVRVPMSDVEKHLPDPDYGL